MTKTQRNRIAKELRDAAERIETKEKHCCCRAIHSDEARKYFTDLFKWDAIDLGHYTDFWFQGRQELANDRHVRNRRVLGLLFAAHLAEEGFEK